MGTMKEYTLVTRWRLAAPIDRVWGAIYAVEAWPRWWRYVQSVVELSKGDANGVGAVRRFTWSSALPYRLSFEMRVTVVEPPTRMEGIALGELSGTGCWHLAADGGTTRVRYDWTVTTTKPWMNLLAPVMRPVFRWNHGQVMAEGARGLARHLGVEPIDSR
jgi:polyketide cyclase/dehydrase/lipid transport protein